MSRDVYKLLYRLDGRERLLLWFSDEPDGVITDAEGRVPTFASARDLIEYASLGEHVVSNEEPRLHDLDAVRAWLADPRAETVDCDRTLCAWNLFIDVARSMTASNEAFLAADAARGAIYRRVFWGCNLPAVTPEGEAFHPSWTREECQELVDLLSLGLDLFARVTRDVSVTAR